ncbi:MAG TPA: sn-glycerol-3-phosphate ABC transporter ATP-binding protein UgpC [Bacilli bacterium]|jgi:multiple sugar transport system ATP-binding protein|nr:sn-glycerol-3-phosphate ABC transporter ATP-binding protein UgpC [Acholeplasmataceae bacterium]OQB66183.1 MAG: Trehalose import ATP-binding protein SugC [Tenericutes bacterium ADurb.Bin140]HOE77111.1 sn-glycerol-3-phosphate ABC transporter ATP-binding protein UgpC [Bacilli bacterium]HON63730.1 sn-glycerol-3-phosphate ABC transporter ATP-binding protein UgpC [Bacilli bacterium]HOR95431.1 sn-glycerol-3-phosphate ABC transporter ATP-binding protein UgpC [Bacilli bacterium]
MATVELKNINKIYDNNVQAVFDFNLKIKDREFIVLVGPSGCGKTTTLRMIAGLEEITSGQLLIDDEVMNDVAPKDRNIAMVFQSYALYPHMSVYDNMAFGLKLRKFSRDEIDRRVQSAAETLGLKPYLDRRPKALSGGQRQRVALGRAIVRDAKVFLMDEPLSNLDAKLRVQMRSELIKLHESLGTTTIYVTHDQIEAMTMATRIVVMKDGWIQQIGAPKEIYDFPNNMFVGGFIGTPPMNFIEGRVGDDGFFECGDHKHGVSRLRVPEKQFNMLKEKKYLNKPIVLGIRPEDIKDDAADISEFKDATLTLKVDVAELLGPESLITVRVQSNNVAGQPVTAKIKARTDIHINDMITLAFDMSKCHFFDIETELRIKED